MAIDRVQPSDPVVRRMQDRIVTLLNEVADCPLLDGRMITVSVPAGSFLEVEHGLGRAPQGWFLVAPKGDTSVWEDVAYTGRDRAKVLRLQASIAVHTLVWVF